MEENENDDFLDDFDEDFEDEEEMFQPFEYSIPDDKLSQTDLLKKKLCRYI